jgi:hypothetical protein
MKVAEIAEIVEIRETVEIVNWSIRQLVVESIHNHLTIGLVDDLTCCLLLSAFYLPVLLRRRSRLLWSLRSLSFFLLSLLIGSGSWAGSSKNEPIISGVSALRGSGSFGRETLAGLTDSRRGGPLRKLGGRVFTK